jgi:hypothetical protein
MWIMIPQDTELPTEAAVAQPDVVVQVAEEEHRAEAEKPEEEVVPVHRDDPEIRAEEDLLRENIRVEHMALTAPPDVAENPDVVVREAVEEHRAEAENPEGEDTPGHRAGPADPNPAEEEKERKIILHVRRDILSEHL